MTREALWAKLREAALVKGEVPPHGTESSPWAVRVMLGVAGWIGALFLLGFVGAALSFVFKNAAAAIIVGALACAAAATLFRANPKSEFVMQFGLAVSFAGQALMATGIAQALGRSPTSIALVIALQQALLFVLVLNFIHRVWTAWSGAYAAAFALADVGLHVFAPAISTAAFAWVWLAEFDHARRGSIWRAGGYRLALAAVQAVVTHGNPWIAALSGRTAQAIFNGSYLFWMGKITCGAVLVWAVLRLLRREGVAVGSGPGRAVLVGAAILALLSVKAPGVGPAVAILVIGYANANRVLAGLGVFALLGYLSQYYYSLHATLLDKSIVLSLAGGILLAVRLVLNGWWPEEGKVKVRGRA